jgi:Animal haem peroxidase
LTGTNTSIFIHFISDKEDIFISLTSDCCGTPQDTEKCAPVTVTNDPFYPNGKCLNFVRSLIFCEELGCNTDPMNILTAYIDGSNIYGSDVGNATLLRNSTGFNVLKLLFIASALDLFATDLSGSCRLRTGAFFTTLNFI